MHAVGTCVKRVGDYFKFALWILTHGVGRPMAPTEVDVYNYVSNFLLLQGQVRLHCAVALSALAFGLPYVARLIPVE